MTETKAKPRLASLRTTSTARVSKGWRHFTITISSSSSSSRERRVAECRRISQGGGRKCWRRRRGRCAVNKIGEKTLEFCPVVVLSARPFFGDYRVSQYQNAKTNVDFIEARDSEWQWHQLGLTQVCASLQTNNHASTHHSGRILFLPPNQQRQSTEGKISFSKTQVRLNSTWSSSSSSAWYQSTRRARRRWSEMAN